MQPWYQANLQVVIYILLVNGIIGLYDGKGAVTTLTTSNFQSLITDSNIPALVEFYAPWCGHCQQFAPTYKNIADKLQGIVTVGAVDCDEDKKLCSEYGVSGFPTIKIFPADKQKNPYTGKISKIPTDYQGQRSAKAISDAAKAELNDLFISKISSLPDYEDFANQNQELNRVLLFTEKGESTALYKSISMRYRGRLAFAEISHKSKALVKKYHVKDFPHLLVHQTQPTEEQVVYSGKLKAAKLLQWLDQFAAKEAVRDSSRETQDGDGAGSEMLFERLNSTRLQHICEEEEDMWLVGFVGEYAEQKQCDKQNLASLAKLVKECQNMFKVGLFGLKQVDEEEEEDVIQIQKLLKQIGVDLNQLQSNPCDPQLILFPYGEDKLDMDEFVRYEDDISDTKAVVKWAQSEVTDMTAMIPKGAADSFLRNAPVIPKIILFTTKEEVPDVFKTIAINFREWPVMFAWVSSKDKQTVEYFGVKKVPSIIIAHLAPYKGEDGEGADKSQMGLAISPYPGPLRYKEMYMYFMMVATDTKNELEGKSDEQFDQSQQHQLQELQRQEEFESICQNAGGICVIGFMNPDSPAHEQHVEILQAVADKRPRDPLRFIWLDATKQPQFIDTFQVSASQIPTVVAYSPTKERFGTLYSTFTAQHIHELLDGVMRGSVATITTASKPTIIEGGVAVEQQQVEDVIIEEEFDLSDIMSEEIEGIKTKEQVLEEVDQKLAQEEQQKTTKKGKKKSKKNKKKKVKDEL
eukprot:TRINITY_DN2369_c0_g1_i4.p1 TRINITY_DN2369_c0_g1~~TRINITY_DN2369_c0_g1_i4.p1  ORF type:complete len:749 (-),score=166.87 TRINITY_DN2369_c0_g1_i4:288-2534(-)